TNGSNFGPRRRTGSPEEFTQDLTTDYRRRTLAQHQHHYQYMPRYRADERSALHGFPDLAGTEETSTSHQDTEARLAAAHPEWNIWRSDIGRWYATLRRQLTKAESDANRARTLDASTSKELTQLLTQQEQLAAAEA
ncbi:hypothetical protein AB0395_46275, partial [Streptosporangium sp. NPDC051023]|uniref:hypothetical protein n=1 Tax=Streptosporangium sp. NPDC051023 TaxID=3155410 RepID=UPI00344CA0CF